ncbi:hypothetical protein GGR56DRAFT_670530 [Xylariaceae sp. FL0804]|nr:hypothetical protein GGR56DRAFT_670530 [Xylariaceae sp. FL0804]
MRAAEDEHADSPYNFIPLVEATRLFRSAKVPVPAIIAGWKEDGKVLTITEQPTGKRLYDIWPYLTRREKQKIAKKVDRLIGQWRRKRSTQLSNLNRKAKGDKRDLGKAVWTHDKLFNKQLEGFGPCSSDKDIFNEITMSLSDSKESPFIDAKVHKEALLNLENCMPSTEYCVLTHGDLSSMNIYVDEKHNVTTITGFEDACYLPVWAEWVCVHFCYCREDEEWKGLLSHAMMSKRETKYQQALQQALDWWLLWAAIRDPSLGRARIDWVMAKCKRWLISFDDDYTLDDMRKDMSRSWVIDESDGGDDDDDDDGSDDEDGDGRLDREGTPRAHDDALRKETSRALGVDRPVDPQPQPPAGEEGANKKAAQKEEVELNPEDSSKIQALFQSIREEALSQRTRREEAEDRRKKEAEDRQKKEMEDRHEKETEDRHEKETAGRQGAPLPPPRTILD